MDNTKDNFQQIGLIGIINMSVLAMIVLWRTIRWYYTWNANKQHVKQSKFAKKLMFHLFLLLTPLSDIPLYVGFYRSNDYDLICYSFHKFETFFLFGALSIIISDWASVLYDIQEYQYYPFLFRKWTLIGINGIYFVIDFANFIILYTLPDLDSYASSPIYICMIFLQIVVALLLTVFMLHAGLKLYFRIHKASGNSLENNHHHSTTRTTPTNTPNTTPQTSSSSRKHHSHTPSTTPMAALPPAPALVADDEETNLNTLQNAGVKGAADATSRNSGSNSGRNSNSSKLRMSASNNSSSITTTTTVASVFNASNIRQSMSTRFQNLLTSHPVNTAGTDGASSTTAGSSNNSLASGGGGGGGNGNAGGGNTTTSSAANNSKEFRQALRNLNIVMFTCTLCIGLQMIMTILNFAFGYAYTADEFVGPPLFYWTCTWFIPLWGPILALLYLARSTNPHQQRARGGTSASLSPTNSDKMMATPMKHRRGGHGHNGGGGDEEEYTEDPLILNDIHGTPQMMNNPMHTNGINSTNGNNGGVGDAQRNRARTGSALSAANRNSSLGTMSTNSAKLQQGQQGQQQSIPPPPHQTPTHPTGHHLQHHPHHRSTERSTDRDRGGIQLSQSQSQDGPSYQYNYDPNNSLQYDDESSNISQMLLGEIGLDLSSAAIPEGEEESSDGHGSYPNHSHRYDTSTQASHSNDHPASASQQSQSYSQYLYRDTTDTMQLPSELHLSNIFLKHLPAEQSSYYYQRRNTNQESDVDMNSELESPLR